MHGSRQGGLRQLEGDSVVMKVVVRIEVLLLQRHRPPCLDLIVKPVHACCAGVKVKLEGQERGNAPECRYNPSDERV